MFKGGEGWGACQKIFEHFSLTVDHFRLFESCGRKDSVQKLITFPEGNKIKFYAVLSHFENGCAKVLRDCPKLRGGSANSGNAHV